jgi:virginiamycin B lyase
LAINEFPIGAATGAGGPVAITAGPDGNLWFTESLPNGSAQVGEINPTTRAFMLFPIPGTAVIAPASITAGPDGNLWFTEDAGAQFGGNAIGQINPTTDAITQFPINALGHDPVVITTGPDRNLWFTEFEGNEIGEINPTTHAIAFFPISTPGSPPQGIVAGPDGNLWFTDASGKIGQINPTTHTIAEFPIPSGRAPVRITLGPDGNLWFTEGSSTDSGANGIGEINPTTHAINEFTTAAGSEPDGIITGSDGNLWFTDPGSSKVGEINPTTHAIAEFPVPTLNSNPHDVAAGPDGNLWFTETTGNKIGQLVLNAAVTAPDLALTASAPLSVTLGSEVTYTLTASNDGTGSATGVTLTDTLPAGATFVSASDGVTPASGVVTFNIGSLAPGASATFTIVVAPTAGGNITDRASVSGSQSDPTPADNTATLSTDVTTVATSPDLALSGNAPSTVTLGGNVTYNVTVVNNGTAGATGVKLTDTLPAGVTFVSATGGVTPLDGILTFDIGNLAAGASASFTIVATPTAAGTIENKASVAGNESDPTPADNSITQTTMVSTGPTVTGVQRFGFHAQATTLVLTFDTQLDSRRAQNPDNYQIEALDGPRRVIRIRKAVYNAAARTVTLSPEHRLNLHNRFRLTVVGTGPGGVSDALGNLLDGQNARGDSGSNFVTIVNAADLVLTTSDPAILRAYRRILSQLG